MPKAARKGESTGSLVSRRFPRRDLADLRRQAAGRVGHQFQVNQRRRDRVEPVEHKATGST